MLFFWSRATTILCCYAFVCTKPELVVVKMLKGFLFPKAFILFFISTPLTHKQHICIYIQAVFLVFCCCVVSSLCHWVAFVRRIELLAWSLKKNQSFHSRSCVVSSPRETREYRMIMIMDPLILFSIDTEQSTEKSPNTISL